MLDLRPRHWLAPLLAAVGALPLSATADDFVQKGWYLGGRGLYTQVNFDTQGVADDDFGFNLFAGYRVYDFLASDIEFEYIDSISVNGKPGPNFDVNTFNVSWLFRFYPLAFVLEPDSPFQRVQPYLVAGPAWQWVELQNLGPTDDHQGGFAGRLGAGFEVYLTDRLAFSADAKYMLATGNVKDFPYWSIGWGFAYHFGEEGGGGGGGGGAEKSHGAKHGKDEDDDEGDDEK